MDLQDIGVIAEIIGAIAVIISLIYLAHEIRYLNRESRVRTIQDLVHVWSDSYSVLIESNDVAEIARRGYANYNELSGEEQFRFGSILARQTRLYESLHFEANEGYLDQKIWQGIENSIIDIYSLPGIQEWWQLRAHWYSKDFQKFLNAKVPHQEGQLLFPADSSGVPNSK